MSLYLLVPFLTAAPGAEERVVVVAPGEGDLLIFLDMETGRLGVARLSREVRLTCEAVLLLLVLVDNAGGVVLVAVRGDLAIAGDDNEPRGEAA
jgi:hypothetical protein